MAGPLKCLVNGVVVGVVFDQRSMARGGGGGLRGLLPSGMSRWVYTGHVHAFVV